MQTPQSPSLEALVRDADREDAIARARQLPTNQTVQLPPQPGDEVSYVPAPKAIAESATQTSTATNASATPTNAGASNTPAPVNVSLNTNAAAPSTSESAKTNEALKPNETSGQAQAAPANAAPASVTPTGVAPASVAPAQSVAAAAENKTEVATVAAPPAESSAELLLLPEQQELKVGERKRLMLFLKTDAPLGLATATLRFDPRSVVVRSVSQGMLATDKASAPVLTQSLDAGLGVLLLSVAPAAGAPPLTGEGLLLVIEVEGLAAGDSALQFDADKVHLIATDGRTVHTRVSASKFKVTQ